MSVCVHRCTDVSQSASLHAEACPLLGSQPTQEVSALTRSALGGKRVQ